MKILWEKRFKGKKDLFSVPVSEITWSSGYWFWACGKTEYGSVKYVAEEAKMPGTRHSLQDHTSSTYFLQLGPTSEIFWACLSWAFIALKWHHDHGNFYKENF